MNKSRDKYNAFSLLQFIWERKKWFLIICCATFVISLVCSFFVRSRYKSTAVIYAPRTPSVAKILLNEQNYNERLDMLSLATVDETEQMMPFLNSVAIKDSLIEKYNLAEYYSIDLNKKGGKEKLYSAITNNMVIKRTNVGAISITISDWDPVRACDMTNDVLRWLDTVKRNSDYPRLTAACTALQRQIDSIEIETEKVNDSIGELMKHGVFDVRTQSERLTQQYAIAVAQGNAAVQNRLKNEMDTLAKYGPQLTALQALIENFSEYRSLCIQKMLDAQFDMSSNVPVKFVIDKPFVADKKFYPKRSIIVIVSTLCAFALTLIVLLTIEKIEERKDESEQSAEQCE